MFDEFKIAQMNEIFKRIFALNITRSTFREIQNVMMNFSDRNEDLYKMLMEAFLTGEVSPDLALTSKGDLQALINEYGLYVRVCRDVHDRGEYISFLTSDLLTQGEKVLFANTLRRMDNLEYRFISDIESTLQLINHFIGRLQESKKLEFGKKTLDSIKDELFDVKVKLEDIIR